MENQATPFTFTGPPSLTEATQIAASGRDAAGYLSLSCMVQTVQVAGAVQFALPGEDAPREGVILNVQILVPVKARSLMSGVMGADGKPAASASGTARVLPVAPSVRLLLPVDALSIPVPAALPPRFDRLGAFLSLPPVVESD